MSVVAFLDQSTAKSVVEHAVWACARLNQPLVLVLMGERAEPDPGLSFDDYQSMRAQDDVLREFRPSEASRESDSGSSGYARELIEAAHHARDLGVPHARLREADAPIAEYIADHTDSDDLLIIPRFGEQAGGLDRFLESVLHVQHRTMLLVPDSTSTVNQWLLAYDGKPGIGEAVRYLSKFPLLSGIPGRAVIAGNDGFGKIHFRDAVSHLQSSGHEVTGHELKGSAEDILLAVLDVTGSDLLVMGAFGGGKLRSMVEGSTTARMLKAFQGPILVSRA